MSNSVFHGLIRYGHSDDAWASYPEFVASLIRRHSVRAVLEVGGGANPTMPLEQVRAYQLDYTVLDLSEEELAKAPAGYLKLKGDITDTALPGTGHYDLVFSRMLAEHVKNGRNFHENVRRLLRPGGIAFHFFPTLYTLPFLVNRLMPERLGERIVRWLRPKRDSHRQAVFPAYYSWCRGPTRGQIKRLQDLGYEIIEYKGYFGHEGYYERMPWLARMHLAKTRFLMTHPSPWFCSFAYLVLRKVDKPDDSN